MHHASEKERRLPGHGRPLASPCAAALSPADWLHVGAGAVGLLVLCADREENTVRSSKGSCHSIRQSVDDSSQGFLVLLLSSAGLAGKVCVLRLESPADKAALEPP